MLYLVLTGALTYRKDISQARKQNTKLGNLMADYDLRGLWAVLSRIAPKYNYSLPDGAGAVDRKVKHLEPIDLLSYSVPIYSSPICSPARNIHGNAISHIHLGYYFDGC